MENSRTAMFREAGRFEGDAPLFKTLGRHRDPLSGAFVYTSTKLDLSDPDRHHLTGTNNDLDGVSYRSLDATLVRQR